jgi:outer membrane scaffolding protein for murein synthesis (MipA/OmpV family)
MRYFTCVALTACLASPAFAQSMPNASDMPSAQELANRDTFTLGLGAGLVPDYEGSDDYRIIPAGGIRGQYHGISFGTRGLYLYADLIPRRGNVEFDAGPIIGARLNKHRHIKDDFVERLPRLKTAIEAGAFVGVSYHNVTNPYDTLSIRYDIVHDIGGAHRSTVFSPNLDFSTPLSRATYVSANVGAEFVSNRYADYYFGIRPSEAIVSGLPAFDPDGGIKNWKAGLLLNQSLTGDLTHGFSLFGTGQYSHLLGDFKRSPIVSLRGSASQWLLAAGAAYTW